MDVGSPSIVLSIGFAALFKMDAKSFRFVLFIDKDVLWLLITWNDVMVELDIIEECVKGVAEDVLIVCCEEFAPNNKVLLLFTVVTGSTFSCLIFTFKRKGFVFSVIFLLFDKSDGTVVANGFLDTVSSTDKPLLEVTVAEGVVIPAKHIPLLGFPCCIEFCFKIDFARLLAILDDVENVWFEMFTGVFNNGFMHDKMLAFVIEGLFDVEVSDIFSFLAGIVAMEDIGVVEVCFSGGLVIEGCLDNNN